MKKMTAGIGLALVVGLSTAGLMPDTAAQTAERKARPSEPRPATGGDSLPNPLGDKQAELRQTAVANVLNGAATPTVVNGNRVLKTGREPRAGGGRQDQYVELENERTDRVFVLLVEFGDQRHPDFPDVDVDPDTPGPTRFDGPRFNEIPEPGPNDNSTGWRPNFSKSYFRKLYFGPGPTGDDSLRQYYEKQSSGRYSVEGMVTDFTRVQYNEARYGRPFEGVLDGVGCTLADLVCSNTWALIGDGMAQWVADQKAAGRTDAQIAARLRSFDVLDRYDFDGDGNFDEPDGYVDRFQIVHAGGDQADGDPIYGEDAIWSHRSYSHYPDIGTTGPAENPAGGTEIADTGIWVGDYTINPENGGLSTIAHEYGHDLGLPDLYDTFTGDDNPVEWWSLMAQSRVSAPGDRGIGTRAQDLGAWEKLQLGWLDYRAVDAGKRRLLHLGPHEFNTRRPQALAVVLPEHTVTVTLPTPPEGAHQWWSGAGHDYVASMTRGDIALPAGAATLNMQLAYNIEEDFDYAFLEVESPAGSGNWVALPTGAVDPDTGTASEAAIDGSTPGGAYVPASFDLSAYAGQTIGLRARYVTDGAVMGDDPDLGWSGLLMDDIEVVAGATTVFADGAETSPNGWTLDGFSSVGTTYTADYAHFYLASYRAYVSYDKYLRSGPYNFGFASARPNWVEHFPYQDGLLVNYWDTAYADNNTSEHPGHGLVLPVDSHPRVNLRADGEPWRGRVQVYDSPFGLDRTDSFTLHFNGAPSRFWSRRAQPVFADGDPLRYFTPYEEGGLPEIGVIVGGVGVKIEVLQQHRTNMKIKVW